MDSFWNRVESTKFMGGSLWVDSFIGSEERRELGKKDVGNVA